MKRPRGEALTVANGRGERGGLRRVSLVLWALAAMVVLAGCVEWAAVRLPGWRLAVWLGGLGFAGLLAMGLRLRLRADMKKAEWLVQCLPSGAEEEGESPALPEFSGLVQALARASERLDGALSSADGNRRQLEGLLDSMQDAVVAVDGEGRIQWTNQRMRRMMARTPAAGVEDRGVRVGHALVQTIRDPEVLECVRTAMEAGEVCVRRSISLMPGSIYEVNASPMPGGGAVAVLHDVTRIEEMERAQRDFVANVSHELRTPLTSISGYVETLLDHEASLSGQAREFLETILKNATRMQRLTEDLLVMARVEAPAMELTPRAVPAADLVWEAVRAMSGLVQETEATLEVGEATGCEVLADGDAVVQVLGNLIENALKYGTRRVGGVGGARVTVMAREVSLPVAAVEFSVRDSGAGIASEHLTRIFERFYRVDKTRSRASGGTGLGLAIARHMVQVQGGRIWAESELGAGSTFYFTLPKAPGEFAGLN